MEDLFTNSGKEGKTQANYFIYRTLLNDLPAVTSRCNDMCIGDFKEKNLTMGEVVCIQNCFSKIQEQNIVLLAELYKTWNLESN